MNRETFMEQALCGSSAALGTTSTKFLRMRPRTTDSSRSGFQAGAHGDPPV